MGSVTVKRIAFDHSTIPPTESSTVVNVGLKIYIDPISVDAKKNEKGQIDESTHIGYVSDTASINIMDRFYSGTSVDYYEVLGIKKYAGHHEIKLKEVIGR